MGNGDIKREEFKLWLKESGYTSIRDFAENLLYSFKTEKNTEVKRLFFKSIRTVIAEKFGSDVSKDVLFVIGKLYKEERQLEDAILNDTEEKEDTYDEYEKLCNLYDKYDFEERKAMKIGQRNLDFYDGHVNDIEDYNIGFEDGIKIYTPADKNTKTFVRRKLKKFTD